MRDCTTHSSRARSPGRFCLLVAVCGGLLASSGLPALVEGRPKAGSRPRGEGAARQPRSHGTRVSVDPANVRVEDGDTVVLGWTKGDSETVRILGIDAPELRSPEHGIPETQSFGPEARAFARGAFAAATKVELLRAATLDPYGRSLGYLFLNGRNFSVLILRARLAAENVSHFGDNGLPAESAEVATAARESGPLPFEPPYLFRARMKELSRWLGARGAVAEP